MKLLIVVDMQNDFVRGPLGSEAAQKIIPNIEKKINSYAEETIIFTQDTHYGPCDYPNTLEGQKLPVLHCTIGTDGWEIIPELKDYALDTIRKETFGYLDWKELINAIMDDIGDDTLESIELCGVCTDICLVSNALVLRALYPNVPIYVDNLCCAGTSAEAHQAALAVMNSCQIDII